MIADICFIEGCQETNYFGDSQSSPTFYRFPSDKNLCMQWENVILVHNKQRNGREHNENSKICSKHFVKNDLIRLKVSNQLHIILRENAIPKIFPNFKGSKYDVQILKCGEPDRDNLIEDDDHDEDDSDDEFGKGSNDIICDPDPDILDEIKSERSSPSSSPSPEKTVQQNDIVTIDLLESSPETNHQYSEIIKIEDTEIMDYDINLQNSDEDDNDDDDDDDDNFDSIQLINGDFYDGNNSIDYDTNLGELALSNIGKTFTMANGNICIRIPPKIVKQTNNNADALPIISDVDIVKMSSIDSISTIDNTTSIIDTTSTVADLYSTSNASTSLNSTSNSSNNLNNPTSNSSNNLNSTSTININTCKSPTTTITTTTSNTSHIVNNANNEIIIVPIYNKTGQAIGYERIDPTKPIKVVNKHKKRIEWKFKKQKKLICGSGDSGGGGGGGGGNPDVDVEPEHCIVTPKNSKNNCNNDPSTIINTNIQSQQHQQQQEQSKQSQLQQSYHQSHLQSHEQLQQLLEQSQQLLQQSQQSQPQYDELIAPQTFEKYKEAKKNNTETEPSNDNVDDDITCTTGGGGRVGDGNLLTDNEKKLQYNVERQKVLINQLQRMVSNSLTNANRLAQELFRAERQNKLTLNEINEYKQQQQMREQKTEPQSQSQSQSEPSPFLKLDNNKTALQRFIISTALLEQSQNEPQQQQQPTTNNNNNNNNQQRTPPPPPPPELYPIDVKSFAMNLYKISSASYDYVRIHLPNLPTVRTVTTWINDKTILTTAAGNVINTSDHYRTVPTTSQNNMSTVATVEKHKKRTIKKKSTMPNDKNRKRKEAIKSTKIVSTSFKSSSNKSISELNEHHFNIKSSTTTTNNNTNTNTNNNNNNISLISTNHLLVDNLSDYTTDFLTDSVMNSIIDCSADDVDVEQDHNITSNT